ncbi:hypothetical protein AXK60_08970 [Tsukamurella pseudospumae]|uniref:Uncharacterized protein n=1 Tax=Tsukamurella pseudospumae TaxID=239498 RepID=A0A138AE90_9ACTN|nr:hypothetical protein AXK60_08970 [Tsukamurella pseudospumae]
MVADLLHDKVLHNAVGAVISRIRFRNSADLRRARRNHRHWLAVECDTQRCDLPAGGPFREQVREADSVSTEQCERSCNRHHRLQIWDPATGFDLGNTCATPDNTEPGEFARELFLRRAGRFS